VPAVVVTALLFTIPSLLANCTLIEVVTAWPTNGGYFWICPSWWTAVTGGCAVVGGWSGGRIDDGNIYWEVGVISVWIPTKFGCELEVLMAGKTRSRACSPERARLQERVVMETFNLFVTKCYVGLQLNGLQQLFVWWQHRLFVWTRKCCGPVSSWSKHGAIKMWLIVSKNHNIF